MPSPTIWPILADDRPSKVASSWRLTVSVARSTVSAMTGSLIQALENTSDGLVHKPSDILRAAAPAFETAQQGPAVLHERPPVRKTAGEGQGLAGSVSATNISPLSGKGPRLHAGLIACGEFKAFDMIHLLQFVWPRTYALLAAWRAR